MKFLKAAGRMLAVFVLVYLAVGEAAELYRRLNPPPTASVPPKVNCFYPSSTTAYCGRSFRSWEAPA